MQPANFTIKNLSKKFHKKRFARILAIQAHYNLSIEGSVENIDTSIYNAIKINEIVKNDWGFDKSDEVFLINLARGVDKKSAKLIEIIQNHLAENWKFVRLGKVVQSILKVGAFELMDNQEQLDSSIIINEYLDIAKDLNHDGEAGFINSVLDAINKELIAAKA